MSLHRIIIADDENFITDSIDEIIDFNSLGFLVAGKFNNGNDVIEFLKHNKADAVITDIRMSKCSGLDIVNFIKDSKLDIEIIFLTAFPLFEYAQFGIKNNIFDYLLKPINIDEISASLASLNNFLTKKKAALPLNDVVFKNHISPKLQKTVSDFFSNAGTVTSSDFSCAFSEYNFNIDPINSFYTILNIQFIDLDTYLTDTWSHGRDALMQAVQNLLCRANIFVCPFSTNFDNMSILLIYTDSVNDNHTLVADGFISQFCNDCIDYLDLHIRVSSTGIFRSLDDLISFYSLTNKIDEGISLVFQNILSGKIQHALDELTNLIQHCKNSVSQSEYLISSYMKKIRLICDLYKIEYSGLSDGLKTILSSHDTVQFNYEADSLLNYTAEFYEFVSQQSVSTPIHIAVEYIKEHFTQNISLSDVAKYISYTPPYLSKILKKELGMPFVEYLNSLRLSYSAQLLVETNKNIEDISIQSGYQSFNYFYKKFKLMYGCTPNVYRRNNKKIQSDYKH